MEVTSEKSRRPSSTSTVATATATTSTSFLLSTTPRFSSSPFSPSSPPPPRLQKQKKIAHTLWGSNPRPLGCNRGRQMSRGSKPSALIHCAKGALFSSRSFLGAAKTVCHF